MEPIRFKLERETKGTYVYEEVVPSGQPPKVKTLYVQKWALPTAPRNIVVTIEEGQHER